MKVNLTADSYGIIKMNQDEKTEQKGFSHKISEWLHGFGKSGQVHAEDLSGYLEKTSLEFLRSYFTKGNTSLSIFYRRLSADGYRRVMMEMIPSDDYTAENQTLYLYVKDIGAAHES